MQKRRQNLFIEEDYFVGQTNLTFGKAIKFLQQELNKQGNVESYSGGNRKGVKILKWNVNNINYTIHIEEKNRNKAKSRKLNITYRSNYNQPTKQELENIRKTIEKNLDDIF